MTHYYVVNENGDWMNAEETTEGAKVYDADEHVKSLVNRVAAWDHEKVEDLMDILDQIPEALRDAGYPPRTGDVIDYSDLPSEPVPEKIAGYPVWACDKQGNCLVGDAADQIEHIASIIEWYEDKEEQK